MGAIPKVYYDTGVEVYKPLAMEGEGGKPPRYRWHLGCILLEMPAMSLSAGLGSLETLGYQTLGWCEGCVADDPLSLDGLDLPMIDKAKWVSGGKTLSHWSDRYAGSPESRDQFGGLYVREHSLIA